MRPGGTQFNESAETLGSCFPTTSPRGNRRNRTCHLALFRGALRQLSLEPLMYYVAVAYSNPIQRREYIRSYQRRWMAIRRQQWIEANGPCRSCGSGVDLEVDHVDPLSKSCNPAMIWSRRAEVRDVELAKCQVLCSSCHSKKTYLEGQAFHGTNARYDKYKCRCEPCRKVHSEKMKRYRAGLRNR